jgi:hypothetical protein
VHVSFSNVFLDSRNTITCASSRRHSPEDLVLFSQLDATWAALSRLLVAHPTGPEMSSSLALSLLRMAAHQRLYASPPFRILLSYRNVDSARPKATHFNARSAKRSPIKSFGLAPSKPNFQQERDTRHRLPSSVRQNGIENWYASPCVDICAVKFIRHPSGYDSCKRSFRTLSCSKTAR